MHQRVLATSHGLVNALNPLLLRVLTDSIRRYNPKPPCRTSRLGQSGDSDESVFDVGERHRLVESQDGDSPVTTWREPERIGKIRAERNQPPILDSTDLDQSRIGDRTKILLGDGRDLPASVTEKARTARTEVLIELDFQKELPHLHGALARHLRSIGETRSDVVCRELWILREDLIDGRSRGEEIDDERNPDAMPTDTRFATTNRGVAGDSL